jgi:hypothetical protein
MPQSTTSRSRRVPPGQVVLGAIDEMSRNVLPDMPHTPTKQSGQLAKTHVYHTKRPPTIARGPPPPPSQLDLVLGPNGERFTDLRLNRKGADAKAKGVIKRLMCFG